MSVTKRVVSSALLVVGTILGSVAGMLAMSDSNIAEAYSMLLAMWGGGLFSTGLSALFGTLETVHQVAGTANGHGALAQGGGDNA